MKKAILHISGDVRQSGFRAKIVDIAKALDIKGYVANLVTFNLFWKNGSWQKIFTAEEAERRRCLLFFSACLCALCGFLNRPSK